MLELSSNTLQRVIRILLILCLSFVFSIFICKGWHEPAKADAAVTALDAWPATPQLSATTGNPTGTFTISAGSNRLLVVAVGVIDSANTAWAVTATYGGQALTQSAVPQAQRRTAWIGYLNEAGIAGRSGDTLTVTITGAHTDARVYIASYTGVDQTTPATGITSYVNNVATGALGSLTAGANDAGYRAYIWAGNTAVTRTSDTETFTEHSDLTNQGTILTLGMASKAIPASTASNPTVTWSGASRTATASIMLNAAVPGSPGTLQLSLSDYSVNEAAGTATITVTRAGGSSGAASVQYATSDGSANQPGDYTSASGTLNWADGDAADKTFTVTIIDDAAIESSETVNLTLSNATGASMGTPNTATITISDNDVAGPGSLQFNSSGYSVDETAGTVTITVTRTGGSSGAASVNYATSNDTALAGSDYTSTSGTLNWADGDSADKTFTVSITNDPDAESNEAFNLTLSGATGASMGTPSSSAVTIPFNDGFVPPPAVPAGNAMLFGILFIGIAVYGLMKGRKKEV